MTEEEDDFLFPHSFTKVGGFCKCLGEDANRQNFTKGWSIPLKFSCMLFLIFILTLFLLFYFSNKFSLLLSLFFLVTTLGCILCGLQMVSHNVGR